MINMSKGHLAVMMEAGFVYLGMGRFKEARSIFEGVAVLTPDSEIPVVAQGNVEFCDGHLEKAVKKYEQALKIDPESAFAKVYLGEALLFMGKKDAARELLQDVAKHDKGGSGEFAKALMDVVKTGFDPSTLRTRRAK